MANNRKKELYEDKKTLTIFILIDQFGKRFFVWKTQNSNLKTVYEMHYFLKISTTKEMFEQTKRNNTPPEMYVLETIEDTEAIAFKHCLAWTKYFIIHGFRSLNANKMQEYTEEFDNATDEIFQKIRYIELYDILNKEHQVFADYGKLRAKKNTDEPRSKRKFTIELTKDEYETLLERADAMSMKPTKFLKEMAIYGMVYKEDYQFFMEYKDKLSEIERRMKGILFNVFETQKYYPADMNNLKILCDQVGEIHRDAMRIFNKRKYGKRTRRK